MKRLVFSSLAVLLAACFGAAPQGTTSPFTGDQLNCRGWNPGSSQFKLGMMTGLFDGYLEAAMRFVNVPDQDTGGTWVDRHTAAVSKAMEFPLGKASLTVRERVQIMDGLCAPPENSLIQVSLMMHVAAMKADGEPTKDIDLTLELARKLAAGMK